MNRRKVIPFVVAMMLLAGVASARRTGMPATPQADEPKPKPSASAPAKPKPPKPDQPKKPPPDEGGW